MKTIYIFLLISIYFSMKLSDVFGCNNVDNVIEPKRKSQVQFGQARNSLNNHRKTIEKAKLNKDLIQKDAMLYTSQSQSNEDQIIDQSSINKVVI